MIVRRPPSPSISGRVYVDAAEQFAAAITCFVIHLSSDFTTVSSSNVYAPDAACYGVSKSQHARYCRSERYGRDMRRPNTSLARSAPMVRLRRYTVPFAGTKHLSRDRKLQLSSQIRHNCTYSRLPDIREQAFWWAEESKRPCPERFRTGSGALIPDRNRQLYRGLACYP
jgi:hypothetical protein